MNRGRLVTLVVVDDGGRLQGVIGPAPVALPWWQEAGPIVDAVPGAVVLRLLDVTATDEGPMGGNVVYLAQLQVDRTGGGPLRPWPGALDDDTARRVAEQLEPQRLRHRWAEPGGPAADLAWVGSQVTISGPPRQHRTWNLSAVWSIPTTDGTVWLKCLPPFFAHEPAVIDLLGPASVPRLIAAEGHRMLLAAMPGHDGYEADQEAEVAMIDALVGLQAGTINRIDRFLEAGVPDLRAEQLQPELSGLVARIAPDSRPLQELVADLPRRLRVAADGGVPDALCHGDPHGGNCRLGVDPPIWFDWGDSFIGNPLLDVAALHRMTAPAVDHWMTRWADVVPGSEPQRAWSELRPVAALRMAWVYQRFLDGIEPSEHIYHRADVASTLADVEEMVSPSGDRSSF